MDDLTYSWKLASPISHTESRRRMFKLTLEWRSSMRKNSTHAAPTMVTTEASLAAHWW